VTLYDLKPAFQALLRPLVGRLAGLGVTANQVTVFTALVSLALGGGLCLKPSPALFLVVAPWMFARMALNAMDGMLAREFGQASVVGAYLNELADVLSDAALCLPFALQAAAWLAPGLALVFVSILSEFAGALGVGVGAGRRNEGPMGKSDRALLLALLGLWHGIAGTPFRWTGIVLWAASALVCVNILRRASAGARLAARRT
jgi:CDP-diacylglycerol---glycerol-3-phosphate 3-phosphatidyltransferase